MPLTHEQGDKRGIDWSYVRNRSLFLPRSLVCGSCRMRKATQAREARTTGTIKAYECPVRGWERSDPLNNVYVHLIHPWQAKSCKKVASCIWHRSDQSGTQELKWLDMSATPRDCCSSRYDKARREISSREWPSKSFPSTVCSPCSPEEAPPFSNSRGYWQLKLRDASMSLESAKCEGRHLRSEIQRLREAQQILVTGAGSRGGESRCMVDTAASSGESTRATLSLSGRTVTFTAPLMRPFYEPF